MRIPYFLLLALLATNCALTPDEVVPAQPGDAHAVVFDIDGTLTPDVHMVFTARDGAARAVRAFADSGVEIVYLTARVTMLQSAIPGWLEENGFPEGSIHVTETAMDRDDHAAFKLRVLESYLENGWTFVAAYGDSSTDFEAYAGAGLPRDRVFALLRDGDEDCQPGKWQGCYATWAEQMDLIAGFIGAEN